MGVVLDKTLLRGLVIIRRNKQQTVGTHFLGLFGKLDGKSGVVSFGPAMTGIRWLTALMVWRMTSTCSSRLKVLPSPVVSQETIAATPPSICSSTISSIFERFTEPSSFIGVIRAVATPRKN